MKTVKVAILGGGWFGNFHLDHLLKMEGVEVAALATGNAERLAGLAAKAPSARTYQNQRDMLQAETDLDALIACVPPDCHDGIEFMAAERKIDLYMEKPLGVSLEEVRKCEQAINSSGILCAVGYQTRYNPHLEEMKVFLQNHDIGMAVAKWFGVMPSTSWWRVKARSGGQLAEQVTHMIDVMRYLFGDVESVYAKGRTGLITGVPNYDVEDCSAAVFTFENGVMATVSCGCFVDEAHADSEIRLEVYAKKARAEYEWDKTACWGNSKCEQTVQFGNEFHYPALAAFLEAVRTRDASMIKSPYSDAVKTFTATYAANLSMARHREIRLCDI